MKVLSHQSVENNLKLFWLFFIDQGQVCNSKREKCEGRRTEKAVNEIHYSIEHIFHFRSFGEKHLDDSG